jgi:IclR family acetate operon transcriptional repressor
VRTRSRPGQPVQSVARSLDLLEALALPGELGLVELAERTGLQPSTVHRLLRTLVDRGYVVQSAATGRYLLGYRLAELAASVDARTERLRALARPHLHSIQKVTHESANLSLLEPPNTVYIDQVEGSLGVRMFARIGAAVPAHATAAGKAILAFLRPEVVLELCGPEPLTRLTDRTITSAAQLQAQLAQVREDGYALDEQEHELGVACVAAPIFDRAASAVAALSVSAPTPRIHAADPAELGELLRDRAEQVSRALGFAGGYPAPVG